MSEFASACLAVLLATAPVAGDVPITEGPGASASAPGFESFVTSAALRWPQAAGTEASATGAGVAPPGTPAAPVAAVGEFRKDTWTFNAYGSAIFGDSGKGEMYLAHVGAGYYIEDYASLNIDVFGGYVRSGIDDNGGAVGFDLSYRNHFNRSDGDARTIFFEAGGGLQQASTNFSGERHFNFRLHVGFGATFRLDERARLLLGAKYIHISDAGVEGGGGGFDGPMLFGGLTVPF